MNKNTIYKVLNRCNSWNDFVKEVTPLTKKEKGDCFEVLTKYHLLSEPKYATKLKNVWLLKEVPQAIKKKLNLPDSDEGIDLIAETKNGKFWAIQCKYRTYNTSLTRKGLSTFTDLTFNICTGIDFGLVCTNVNKHSYKFEKYHNKLGFCDGQAWYKLDKKFFKNISSDLKPIKPIKCIPRPDQKKNLKEIVKGFKNASRGKFIAACRSGKTLVAYWATRKLKARIIVFCVPSLNLIKQTLESWSKEAWANKLNIDWICVCSDKTVSNDVEGDLNPQDLGIQVDTDSDVIAKFLKESKKRRAKNKKLVTIVFTTYQSGKVLAVAAKKSKTRFDLGIFDEAHKTVGRDGSLFTHLLSEKNIKIAKRLFMTATPKIHRSKDDDILSMDDEKVYGKTIAELTFKEAIETGIICDYKIITLQVTNDEIKESFEKNKLVFDKKNKLSEEVECEMLATVIALRKANKKYGVKKAISFHNSIARAMAFQETNRMLGDNKFDSFHVSSKKSGAIRASEMEAFKQSELGLMTNARCLTEGVDVPVVDCVIFADPKKSKVDITQAASRALTRLKGKDFGYILIPVIADTIEDFEKGAYENILDVVRSLALYDESLVEYFDAIYNGKSGVGGRKPIEIISVLSGTGIDLKKISKAIQIKVWERIDFKNIEWMKSYEDVGEFVEREGRYPSIYAKGIDEAILGRWISHRRTDYKQNKLSRRGIKLLEKLNRWVWDIIEEAWNKQLSEVINFREVCQFLPSAYSTNDKERKLGQWCCAQKRMFKKGKLPKGRIKQLENVSAWVWEIDRNEVWDNALQDIQNYYNKHNRTPPDNSKDIEVRKLRKWISHQKQDYKQNKLSKERINKLENIFWWSWCRKDIWDDIFQDIQDYYSQHNGIPRRPSKYAKEATLRRWVSTQKQNYKKGKLSKEKIEKLESLSWWVWEENYDKTWNNKLQKVIAYYNKHDKIPSCGSRNTEEKKLGSWVTNQKTHYRKHELSKKRTKKLEKLSWWKWAKEI